MTTARDLMITALEPYGGPVERGDLSLALAGAETIDLLGAGVIELDGQRIVPLAVGPAGDRLLTEAAGQVRRAQPYENVTDWLWRRGRGLADVYLADLETEGQVVREERRRWVLFRSSEPVLADSSDRRRAASRWEADEPVLAALGSALGATGAEEAPDVTDPPSNAVLDALTEALGELAEERKRRARKLEDATIDNYRRGY
jgi:hypothetical protein